MILSIITINRNNETGLEQTLQSVLSQSYTDFEYVIVDGASTDNSVEVIQYYVNPFGGRLKWISEPDKGIYNAMNKGIQMATGEYVEFLNSGDRLYSADVVEKMVQALAENHYPSLVYGNLVKEMPDGTFLRDKSFAGRGVTFLDFYLGTLNHSSSFIRRALFGVFGPYDESLRIVADWEWFLKVIIGGGERPIYTNVDVTLFDMHGLSETNRELSKSERRIVLSRFMPPTVLADYDAWASSITQMKRLKQHPWAYRIVWFLERYLFRIEKRKIRKTHEV